MASAKTPPGWYRDKQGRLVRDHEMQLPLSMGHLFVGSALIVVAGIVAAVGAVGLLLVWGYGGGFGATAYLVLLFGTIALGLALLGVRALRPPRTRR